VSFLPLIFKGDNSYLAFKSDKCRSFIQEIGSLQKKMFARGRFYDFKNILAEKFDE
jgi:hypothetical protein